jgi:hypothetical protein
MVNRRVFSGQLLWNYTEFKHEEKRMKLAKLFLIAAAITMMAFPSFALERAFMGFDVSTQRMYTVVCSDAQVHVRVEYSQSSNQGYIGADSTFAPVPSEVWTQAELSPLDPARELQLPNGAINTITATVKVYNSQDNWLYDLIVRDTLQANVNGPDGYYSYVNNGSCTPILPASIAISSSYCAWICHGSYTIPIQCEDPNYNVDLLEVTVTNGCSPTETHCHDNTCPRIDWTKFSWFKRVRPGCQLALTMTYCDANPGCVCIWRSDFRLPVEMLGFTATAGNGSVVVNWGTASETNTNNFVVTRADLVDGIYHTVYSTVAAGNSTTNHNYSWTDTDVQNGHTYYYKLHILDAEGNHVYNHNGETVIVSATPNTDALVPTAYSVGNYPNPFNSQTTFTFSIPFDGHVSLKVFDLLGREVATVVNGNLKANSYSYNWSAEGLATGVYMYTMTSGQFTQTHKLLYIK